MRHTSCNVCTNDRISSRMMRASGKNYVFRSFSDTINFWCFLNFAHWPPSCHFYAALCCPSIWYSSFRLIFPSLLHGHSRITSMRIQPNFPSGTLITDSSCSKEVRQIRKFSHAIFIGLVFVLCTVLMTIETIHVKHRVSLFHFIFTWGALYIGPTFFLLSTTIRRRYIAGVTNLCCSLNARCLLW